MFVGALLLAAFAVLLACALLLLFRHRSATGWLPVLLVAAGLTAGSVWAAVQGGLHPLLWVLFFFGLVYCTVVALVRVAPGDAGRAAWENRLTMSTSIFVGHAKPPSNTVSGQMYTILSVVCEVDMETGVIVAAEFTVATELAKHYLNRLLAGRNLTTDEDAIVAELEALLLLGHAEGAHPVLPRHGQALPRAGRARAGRTRRRSRPRRPADSLLIAPSGAATRRAGIPALV